jgi:hypothetical protein
MEQPFKPNKAKALIRQVLESGVITYSRPHALERLRERNISTVDCENVLRAGKVQEAEYEHGAWRHHVLTVKLAVVIEFLSEQEVLVVTAWRIGK